MTWIDIVTLLASFLAIIGTVIGFIKWWRSLNRRERMISTALDANKSILDSQNSIRLSLEQLEQRFSDLEKTFIKFPPDKDFKFDDIKRFYWYHGSKHNNLGKGPFCPVCLDVDHKAVHLQIDYEGMRYCHKGHFVEQSTSRFDEFC